MKKYTCFLKGVNATNVKEVYAKNKRAAKWTYINLYQPHAKYSQVEAAI